MLTSWDQIARRLLPGIAKARAEPSFAPAVPRDYLTGVPPRDGDAGDDGGEGDDDGKGAPRRNVYERREAWDAARDVNARLNLPLHRCTTPVSTLHTLKYLFYHMKCVGASLLFGKVPRTFSAPVHDASLARDAPLTPPAPGAASSS